jgi:hypothetical protein
MGGIRSYASVCLNGWVAPIPGVRRVDSKRQSSTSKQPFEELSAIDLNITIRRRLPARGFFAIQISGNSGLARRPSSPRNLFAPNCLAARAKRPGLGERDSCIRKGRGHL